MAVLGVGAGCSVEVSDKDIVPISLSEFRAIVDKAPAKVLIVDPRAKVDYDAGHIPGAKNYQINDERARSGDGLNPVFKGYNTIVVYGDDPSSAHARGMSKRLMLKKADDVRMFFGGLIEWRRAGLKVVQSGNGSAAGGASDVTHKAGTLAK